MKEQDFIGSVLPTCRVFEEAYAQIRFTFGCKMLSEPSTRFRWCETGYFKPKPDLRKVSVSRLDLVNAYFRHTDNGGNWREESESFTTQ